MDLTAREVARMLGLGNAAAERVLASGLAGPAHVRGRCHLYDRAAVEALAARPVVADVDPLPPACAAGVLVVRLDPRLATGDATGDAAGIPPRRLSVGRSAVLTVLLARHRRVPLVTSVAGFVLGGGDVVGVSTDDATYPLTTLRTEPAGSWFEHFRGTRLMTGPGDPWLFWRCRWSPPIARDRPRYRDR